VARRVGGNQSPERAGLARFHLLLKNCTNEESYLMQKLARAVDWDEQTWTTVPVYCQAPATMGLFRTVGYGWGFPAPIKDIENASLVIIIGSNTAEAHPVLATRVEKRAHKLRGQKLIVSDLAQNMRWRKRGRSFPPSEAGGLTSFGFPAITRYILDHDWRTPRFWKNG